MKYLYKLEKVKNNIYKITEPFYSESANVFLFVENDKCLLVDSGLGIFNIKNFLLSKGFPVGNIKITFTHSHFDHIGGAKFFLNDEIILPSIIHENIYNEENWELNYFKESHFKKEMCKSVAKKMVTAIDVPKVATYNKKYIKLDKMRFEIIHSPGHTADSIILYDKISKILITGDALYSGKIFDHCLTSDRFDFIQSLCFMEALDFELILPGHNGVLTRKEGLSTIKAWKRHLECFLQ
jgi:glyoxylase-like metal-dependent hydrolase (beta-lactamase superfamily II)